MLLDKLLTGWEGGLTTIELRALRELALGAGARDAVVYQGEPLRLEKLDYNALRSGSTGESA